MRILVVSGLYPPQTAGAAELFTSWIAEAMRARGHEMTVLTSWHGLSGPETGVDAWRLLRFRPSQRFDSSASVISQLRSAYLYYQCHNCHRNGAVIDRAIRKTDPQIIYLAEPSGLGLNSVIRATNASRLPVVIHLHNYWLLYLRDPSSEQSRFGNTLLKKILVGPVPEVNYTSMIAVSRLVKDEHVRAGFHDDRIEVIHNGLPPSTLPQAAERPRPRRRGFLLAARLVEEKGIHVAIQALAILVKELGYGDARLDIVGDGQPAYLEQLRELSLRLGIGENVDMRGKLDRETLLEQSADYTAVLLPSLWKEPFATTVLESMYMGVPIIASRLGGHVEIIEDGGNGLLFNPGDAAQLAQKMHMLLANPELQETVAGNALVFARSQLRFESFVERIELHMERALITASTPNENGEALARPLTRSAGKGL